MGLVVGSRLVRIIFIYLFVYCLCQIHFNNIEYFHGKQIKCVASEHCTHMFKHSISLTCQIVNFFIMLLENVISLHYVFCNIYIYLLL